jgi:hypothetical protein
MQNMSDNELDNLFKEAADGFTPPQDESAWKQMASKLDQHPVGTTSFWNWKTISTLTVTGVISITAVWFATTGNQEQISKTNEHESTNSTQNVVQEQKEQAHPIGNQNLTAAQSLEDKSDDARAVSQSKPNHDTGKLTSGNQIAGNSNNKTQSPEEENENRQVASNNQLTEGNQAATSNQNVSNTGKAAITQQSSGKEYDKSQVASNSQPTEVSQNATTNQITSNNTGKATIAQQSLEKEDAKSQVINNNQITDQNVSNTSKVAIVQQSSGKESDNTDIVSTSDRSRGSSEIVVPGVSAILTSDESTHPVVTVSNSTETNNASKGNPSVTKTRAKDMALVAVDSVKPTIIDISEAGVDSAARDSKVADKKDKKAKQAGVVSIKAVVSPDYSSINFFSAGKTGFNYGLLAGYSFNNRWSVYTGVISSKKLYDTKDVEGSYSTYNWNGHDYPVKELDGDCRILDIPINVYYTFFPERSFSLRAGLGFSSYIMRKETYVYCVDNYGTDAYYAQQVIGKNNEWFKVMNLSIAVSKKITNRWSAEFEPFVKAPLTGVGEGKVSLVSMGAFINLKFDLTKNK